MAVMFRAASLATALLMTCTSVASADGRRAEPGSWWSAWNWDPLILLSLGLVVWFYGRGVARLWARAGWGKKIRVWQAACCLAAPAVLLLALISPLDAISEELASVHMVQHMLLIMVAAPLFVVGSPSFVLAWGLPAGGKVRRRSIASFLFRLSQDSLLWQPLLLWTLFAALMWSWHHPVLYQAALRDGLLHDAQHLSFFVVACLFWRVLLDGVATRRLSPLTAIPYLFATSVQASVLGVFLALSPNAWYDVYAARTGAWGFTPLEDQQLAGLIMWMPACLIFPGAAAIVFSVWLARLPEKMRIGIAATPCQSISEG
jgi:putative membrane protein